jgi:hypothetical protein
MSLFSPLRQAAVAFFKHDVALRREPGGVQIVLEERGPGGQPASPAGPNWPERRKRPKWP